MIIIQEPTDILARAIHTILSSRKDEEFYNLVKDWNKKIVVELKEMYPISIIFQGTNISFQRGIVKKANVKLKTDVETLLDLAFKRLSPVSAVLKRRLKIKGILKIGTLLKLMKIFFKPLHDVAENPNIKYYEQDKDIR